MQSGAVLAALLLLGVRCSFSAMRPRSLSAFMHTHIALSARQVCFGSFKSRVTCSVEGRRRHHALGRGTDGSPLRRSFSEMLALRMGQEEGVCAQNDPLAPVIAFPGGGIYFWWQAGAVKSLQKHYNLSSARLMGASAGALTAALAGCDVDMDKAFVVAQRLAHENNLWGRKSGLMGIWGPIIYEWLDECLPSDAAKRCQGRLYVSVAEVRPQLKVLERCLITDFENRSEFIDACLTSVHIPFFLDGKPFREYRGRKCMDGSITSLLRGLSWHVKVNETVPTIFIDHKEDQVLCKKNWGFLETISESNFKEMFDLGYAYLEEMHHKGKIVEIDENSVSLPAEELEST